MSIFDMKLISYSLG